MVKKKSGQDNTTVTDKSTIIIPHITELEKERNALYEQISDLFELPLIELLEKARAELITTMQERPYSKCSVSVKTTAFNADIEAYSNAFLVRACTYFCFKRVDTSSYSITVSIKPGKVKKIDPKTNQEDLCGNSHTVETIELTIGLDIAPLLYDQNDR